MGISHTTTGPGMDAARRAADRARPSVDDARAALAEAHRATDQLLQTLSSLAPTAPGVDAAALGSLSAEVNRAVNRLESARLRVGHLMAGCRERGGSTLLDEGQFFARDGQRDPAAARKDAHLARELGNGPVAPDGAAEGTTRGRPPAGRAFDEGLISRQHVDVILATLRELPEDVTAAERQEIERDLTRSAQRLSPASLRAAGRRVLSAVGRSRRQVDEHENDLLHRQEEAAWRATRATITHRIDGTSVLHAVLPTFQAMALERVLQAMASPVRRTRPAAVLGRPQTDEESRDQQLDLWHERGLALAELVERLPTEHLHQKVAATVVVHTDLETLRGEAERAGVTDSAHRLSAGEVRRIAAQAGIVPACWVARACRWTWGGNGASSPTRNEWRSPGCTTSAPPRGVIARSPGARCITTSRGQPDAGHPATGVATGRRGVGHRPAGRRGGRRTWPMPSPCAADTTAWWSTPGCSTP